MNKNKFVFSAIIVMFIISVIINIILVVSLFLKPGDSPETITPTTLPKEGNDSQTSIETTVLPSQEVAIITQTTKPNSTFSNNKMSVTLPQGWSSQELANGSVNLLNGDFILFINPNFLQTSGVKGARFDEITQGSPSADLVHVFHPAVECTTPIQTTTQKYKRYDVYTNPNVDSNLCRKTASGETRWYFSYYVKESPYVTYKSSSDYSYVITVSIRVSQISDLPKKDDAILKERLAEIDTIVDSIVIK